MKPKSTFFKIKTEQILTASIIILSVINLIPVNIYSQGVTINTTGATNDPSALLDLQADTTNNPQGLLIPRMSTAKRNAISNPAEGLQIFNTTTKCFEFFAYGVWQTGNCAICPAPGTAGNITGNSSACQGTNGLAYSVSLVTNAVNYVWMYSGTGVTINGNNNSVTLDFAANATSGNLSVKGSNPQCGDGTASPDLYITVNSAPSAPSSGTHTPSKTQIIWNWNSVAGATGYKYNTISNYNAAIDNAANTSYTQTSLNCATSYNLYVWAYNSCGESSPVTLTQTTSSCWSCGDILTVTHTTGAVAPVNKTVNYGTVLSTLGGTGSKCWITQNLGADNQATSVTDNTETSAGWYWQFNRKQGYKNDGTTLTPSSYAGYNPDTYDWETQNDPCTIELGANWRVPTYSEWAAADASWNSYSDAYSSALKLHAAGYLQSGSGTLSDRGASSFYWAGTRVSPGNINSNIWNLNMTSSSSYMNQSPYIYGFSVRCIKD